MVVDRHGQRLLGALLADHVLVQYGLDFLRLGQLLAGPVGLVLEFLADDVVAEFDALIADEYRGPGYELAHLMLALAAEGAVQQLAVVATPTGILAHRLTSLPAESRLCFI